MNKKYLLGTIALAAAIFAFLWYSDVLFDTTFIFGLIPYPVLFIAYIVFAIIGIKELLKGNHQFVVGLIILLATFFVVRFFPFRDAKVAWDYRFHSDKRLEVVEMIADGRIESERALTDLPSGYKTLSSDGTVYVFENDKDGIQVGFWVFRGMLSGSMEVVYSSGGEDLIWKNETGHPIRSIKPLDEYWYYVVTDY